MPMGFAMRMGVTFGVKTEVSPCCETTLSCGTCIGRNVIKGQIFGSQWSQPSHNSPLHTTLTPV